MDGLTYSTPRMLRERKRRGCILSKPASRWYGVATDIEDLKRAEEGLREREQNLRLVVDSIPGLVHTTTAEGELEFVNRQVLDYFGRTLDELKGWATNDFIHPDDLPRVIAAFTSSIETGQPYDIEQRCRRADGAYRWFQVRALPLRDTEDHIIRWYTHQLKVSSGANFGAWRGTPGSP